MYILPADDPLRYMLSKGQITIRVYNALVRSGYGQNMNFEQLKIMLANRQLSLRTRNLGKKGIEQLIRGIDLLVKQDTNKYWKDWPETYTDPVTSVSVLTNPNPKPGDILKMLIIPIRH